MIENMMLEMSLVLYNSSVHYSIDFKLMFIKFKKHHQKVIVKYSIKKIKFNLSYEEGWKKINLLK